MALVVGLIVGLGFGYVFTAGGVPVSIAAGVAVVAGWMAYAIVTRNRQVGR